VGKPDKTEQGIDIGCAIALAAFGALVFLPLSIWVLPWPLALLIVLVVAGGLFEAKRRWDFDIWEWWPGWLWWWW
jgi:hypothetical protein